MSGVRIKEYREKMNFSQRDLAGLLGVSVRSVARWERNISKPHPDEMKKITKITGITEDELLRSDDTSTSLNKTPRTSTYSVPSQKTTYSAVSASSGVTVFYQWNPNWWLSMRQRVITSILAISLILGACSSEGTSESGVDSEASSEAPVIQDSSVCTDGSPDSVELTHSDNDHISEDFLVLNPGVTAADIVAISGSSDGVDIDMSNLTPWYSGFNGFEHFYTGSKVWLSEDPDDYIQADESLMNTIIASVEYVEESELSDGFSVLFNDPQIGDGLYEHLTKTVFEYSDLAVGDDAYILADSNLFPLQNYCMRNEYNDIPIGQISNILCGQNSFGIYEENRYRVYPAVESGLTSLYDGMSSFVQIDKFGFEIDNAVRTVPIAPIMDYEDEIYLAMENYRGLNHAIDYGDITAFAAELCYIPCYPADNYSLEVTDDNGMLIPTWVVYCYSTEIGLFSLYIDPSDGSDLITNGL